jgi:uncharacterized membrane protein YhhN
MQPHAPRSTTIVIAIILVVIGIAGTFFHALPSVGGNPGTTVGVAAYVLATVVMFAGIYFRGL